MRGGNGGDLLEAVDLRSSLAHRDDVRAHPEGLGHPPFQGAGAAGLDETDPYDALLAGARRSRETVERETPRWWAITSMVSPWT